jgi:hypothetical protein
VGEEGTVAMALTAPPAGFDSLPVPGSRRLPELVQFWLRRWTFGSATSTTAKPSR